MPWLRAAARSGAGMGSAEAMGRGRVVGGNRSRPSWDDLKA